jgi:hypothetical protein
MFWPSEWKTHRQVSGMKDRFLAGAIGGLVAGVAMDFGSAFAYYVLRSTTLRTLDWTAIILYGHPPRVPVETLLAEVWHLVWTSLLGLLFVYAARLIPTPHRYLRGVAYGLAIWLFINAAMLLFKVPYVRILSWQTTLSHFILAIIFGVVLAYVVDRLLDEPDIRA